MRRVVLGELRLSAGHLPCYVIWTILVYTVLHTLSARCYALNENHRMYYAFGLIGFSFRNFGASLGCFQLDRLDRAVLLRHPAIYVIPYISGLDDDLGEMAL